MPSSHSVHNSTHEPASAQGEFRGEFSDKSEILSQSAGHHGIESGAGVGSGAGSFFAKTGDEELSAGGMTFTIREFEGPLALLLSLVRQHKMDIYDIPVSEITKQYLQYLTETLVHTLDDLTSFYKMATWLLHIKSHMLLPVSTDVEGDEIDDPRFELVNTLIEYTRFKQLSYLLENRHDEYAHETIARSGEMEPLFEISKEDLWMEVDSVKLLSVFMQIVQRRKNAGMERIIDLNEPVTVREKITLINEMLEAREQCSFEEIIAGGGLLSLVCAFLAILELMKQQKIKVFQNAFHSDIMIHRK